MFTLQKSYLYIPFRLENVIIRPFLCLENVIIQSSLRLENVKLIDYEKKNLH